MTELCKCGNNINFYSESEIYDYTEDMNGKIEYICQKCLDKIRNEYKTQEFKHMIMTYSDKTLGEYK